MFELSKPAQVSKTLRFQKRSGFKMLRSVQIAQVSNQGLFLYPQLRGTYFKGDLESLERTWTGIDIHLV
jgi:hypothetical protein